MANAAPNPSPSKTAKASAPAHSRWLHWLLIGVLLAGISLRFVNIAPKHKAVSLAESKTALHLSGYELADLPLALAQWSQSERSLRRGGHPRAFVLNRELKPFQSIRIVGNGNTGIGVTSVTIWRIISGFLSLLVLPAAWCLVRSLFPPTAHINRSNASQSNIGRTSTDQLLPVLLACLAISPLQLIFAQDAQPTAITFAVLLASQALLLRGIQRRDWKSYVIYGFSLALLALLLQLNPLSALGVVAMVAEVALYLILALIIQQTATTPEQAPPQTQAKRKWLRRSALGLMMVIFLGAIALNIHQVMAFSSWSKGPANGNLTIAEQWRQQPAPLISDPQQDNDWLSLLSLSHSLPDEAQWLLLNTTTATNGAIADSAAIAPQDSDSELASTAPLPELSYLYRPSPVLLESIRTSSAQPLYALGNQLWRWGPEPAASATP